jgi:hypothetical protein
MFNFFKKKKVSRVKTFDDAVNFLIKNFNNKNFNNPYWHHNDGRDLRNDLNLWSNESPIVVFMKNNYGITHADDISGLILNAAIAKLSDAEFDLKEQSKYYLDYWDSLHKTGSAELKLKDGIIKIYSIRK